MGYYKQLAIIDPGILKQRATPIITPPANAVKSSDYRVGWWRNFGDTPTYEYYLTSGEAQKRKRELRNRGLCVVSQYWNKQAEMWIG